MARQFPQEAIDFVKANYRTMGNKQLTEAIRALGVVIGDRTVNYILYEYRLIRTPEERAFLVSELVRLGIKRNAVYKMHKTKGSLKVGDIGFRKYVTSYRWVIKVAPKKFRILQYWLWEKAGRTIDKSHHLEWIDENGPHTIDNIKVVKTNRNEKPPGWVYKWLHEGVIREYVKLANGNIILHETYLWCLHRGEVPPGYYVAKIDPEKPIEIDNLELRNTSQYAKGATELPDWWVAGTINHGLSKEEKEKLLQDKDAIEIQRLRIELRRQIMSLHGKSSGNTPGDTPNSTDNPVAGTSADDEK